MEAEEEVEDRARPKKKQPNIDIEQVQQCLSTIDTGVQNIRGGVHTEEAMTSITKATTVIRTLLSLPATETIDTGVQNIRGGVDTEEAATSITEATPVTRTLLSPSERKT